MVERNTGNGGAGRSGRSPALIALALRSWRADAVAHDQQHLRLHCLGACVAFESELYRAESGGLERAMHNRLLQRRPASGRR